jgi:hypothetical protein
MDPPSPPRSSTSHAGTSRTWRTIPTETPEEVKDNCFQTVIVDIYGNPPMQPSQPSTPTVQEKVYAAFIKHRIPFSYWESFLAAITQLENLRRIDVERMQRETQTHKLRIESDKIKREHRFCAPWAAIVGSLLIALATTTTILHALISNKDS